MLFLSVCIRQVLLYSCICSLRLAKLNEEMKESDEYLGSNPGKYTVIHRLRDTKFVNIFLSISFNICFRCSLHMFLLKNKKITFDCKKIIVTNYMPPIKNFFSFLNQNICCGYSKEPSQCFFWSTQNTCLN